MYDKNEMYAEQQRILAERRAGSNNAIKQASERRAAAKVRRACSQASQLSQSSSCMPHARLHGGARAGLSSQQDSSNERL